MSTQQGNSTESMRDKVSELATQPLNAVKEHPVPSMLVVFGIGMGLGVAATLAMSESTFRHETTSEKWSRQLAEAVNEIKSAVQRGIKSAY